MRCTHESPIRDELALKKRATHVSIAVMIVSLVSYKGISRALLPAFTAVHINVTATKVVLERICLYIPSRR